MKRRFRGSGKIRELSPFYLLWNLIKWILVAAMGLFILVGFFGVIVPLIFEHFLGTRDPYTAAKMVLPWFGMGAIIFLGAMLLIWAGRLAMGKR